ncbi:MAG: CaiB/BaiF CoA-transferase family protein [Gordonia sp. (in: high G+C Gram-positive bacteria)]
MVTRGAPGLLSGLRVVEFVGLGPAPFACMFLADLGAEVVAVARPDAPLPALVRNRPVLRADLKDSADIEQVRRLVERADVVVEGFRPGVMERLGLGPDDLRGHHPELVYARMTGWGQTGPLAHTAGHDINYIGLTGALHLATRAGHTPVPPANLLGDFGGGAMFLVAAVLAAVHRRAIAGIGEVLDIAILDGTSYLTSMQHEYRGDGRWSDVAGVNRLDTGAPYYDVYPCADGRFVAVGALEKPFFDRLVELLSLPADVVADRENPQRWPQLRRAITEALSRRTRDEWDERARGTDACLTPVLDLAESAEHPQVAARSLLQRTGPGTWTPSLGLGFVGEPPALGEVMSAWGVSGRKEVDQ